MHSKDDYRILQLRNEVSFCLDDLAAMVVNSALAYQLRSFSSEVMDLTPGFTLNLKQASRLKALTRSTFKQYRTGAISDVDLMTFQTNAHTLLKGENTQIGGIQMGVFDKLLHGKEFKQRAATQKAEQDYRNVCNQITACQEEMQRCISNCRGQSPESAVYRQNERSYSNANNRLTLLKKQETALRKILRDADQISLVRDFAASQKAIAEYAPNIVGSEKERAELLALVELRTESIKATTEKTADFGASLFEADEEETPITNSEFGALVAADERRQSEMELSGFSAMEESTSTGNSEFDALVSAANSQG